MKGLILKDLYMTAKYCRIYLILLVVCLALTLAGESTVYMTFVYLVIATIPVVLYSYDERSGWCRYSKVFPYTRAQLVSGKYIVGLILNGSLLALLTVAGLIHGFAARVSVVQDLLSMVTIVGAVSLISPAILLPFVFRFGSEKGRIAYYIVMGAACGLWTIFLRSMPELPAWGGSWGLLICGGAVLLYTLSWLLSVSLYQKREE